MARIDRRTVLSLALLPVAGAREARAADFPSQPVTIIVPYAPGGAGDTVLRLLAPFLKKAFGQPIIVDSRAGGGGTIGARAAAGAAPDGHTLLLGAANNFCINQFMFPKVKFDPLTALTPITRVADVPSVIYVSTKVPATTLGEFLAYAKANPGKLNYSSPSVGTTPHLAVERLKQLAAIDIVHVPYRGAPPAMQALLQNDAQLYLAGWGVGRAFVEAGQVRALAITTEQRQAGIPLPTAIEAGVPGFVTSNWWGLAAPSGTPQSTIDRIHTAFASALREPSVVAQFANLGFVAGNETPEQFKLSIRNETAVWEATIKAGNLAVDQ